MAVMRAGFQSSSVKLHQGISSRNRVSLSGGIWPLDQVGGRSSLVSPVRAARPTSLSFSILQSNLITSLRSCASAVRQWNYGTVRTGITKSKNRSLHTCSGRTVVSARTSNEVTCVSLRRWWSSIYTESAPVLCT